MLLMGDCGECSPLILEEEREGIKTFDQLTRQGARSFIHVSHQTEYPLKLKKGAHNDRVYMETSKSTFQALRPVIHLAVASFITRFAYVMTVPFMVDILLPAICPGQIECSQVTIMLGAAQVISGLGAIVSAPILSSLSDDYGRKPLLMAISIGSITPPAILAYSTTKAAVYGWWLASIGVVIIRDGSHTPAVLAYVADVVDESHRAAALGLTTAALSLGYLLGTLTTYLIDTGAEAFMVATICEISGALYLILLVKETNPRQSLLPIDKGKSEATTTLLKKPEFKTSTTNIRETIRTVWTSPRLRIVALVEAMYTFGSSGLSNFTLYYLRTAFVFQKDQYATLELVTSVSSTLGQMFLYPTASYFLGQRWVLWMGLLGSAAHYFIYSFAWSPRLPYIACAIGAFGSLIDPAGKLQGVLSSSKSMARIVASVVLTPLTAAALGDDPPLDMRGLPYLVCGVVTVLAWLVSLELPYVPISEGLDRPTNYIQVPLSPKDFIQETSPKANLLRVPLHPEIVGTVVSGQDDRISIQTQQN